jgi:predicted PurR-regulated permease PerM
MLQKYKDQIILITGLIFFCLAFYYLNEALLPFVLGLLLAFSVFPTISKLQRVIKSRNVANTVFLAIIGGIFITILVFFTQYINRDFKRLNNSFETLAAKNHDKLDKTAQQVKQYLGKVYDFDTLEKNLASSSDSLKNSLKDIDSSTLDTESIKAAFENVVAAFQTNDKSESEEKSGLGLILTIVYALFYFLLILYQYEYFYALHVKFFGGKIKSKANIILDDFNQSFVKYFKLRSKIVLILSLVYLSAFIIMDMPGVLILTIIIAILSYIPYLQYFALIPLSVSCIVLSVENDQSFLLLFGVVLGVFILASILEEAILTPWIMEKNIGMNPVIMILALSAWSYLFGLKGLLIGIPMTSLIIIYTKRYFLPAYQKVVLNEN